MESITRQAHNSITIQPPVRSIFPGRTEWTYTTSTGSKQQKTQRTNKGNTATDTTATKTKKNETTNTTDHKRRAKNGGRGSTTEASL